MKLPKQLRDPKFRFIRLNKYIKGDKQSKAPLKNVLWTKNLLTYKELEKLIKTHNLKSYGVVNGYGGLRSLDVDNLEMIEKFNAIQTFTVKTGRGGRHLFFISDYNMNHVIAGLGELRSKNMFVVGAGSMHYLGKKYKVIKDLPIMEITVKGLKKILDPYLKSKTTLQKTVDTTRSGVEFGEVCRLIEKGWSKERVFGRMDKFDKWSKAHNQYRELTYEKALKEVGDKAPKGIVLIGADELMKMDLPKTDWLVENLIPAAKLGMLAGRKGNYKSFLALRLALSIASGSDFCGRKVKKGKVIYFDEEIGDSEFKQRIKMVAEGMGIDHEQPNLKVFFTSFNDSKAPQLDREKDRKAVQKIIENEKPLLIIFDVMRRFHSIKENKADEVQKFYRDTLKPMFESNGITLLGVFHNRKAGVEFKSYTPYNVDIFDMMDEVRSSSEWVNICSFFIEPKRFNSRSLYCGLYSYVRNHSSKTGFFRIEFKKDRIFFTETDKDEIERIELISDNSRVKEVVEWLKDKENFTTKDLKKLFNNRLDNRQIQRILTYMTDAGIIKKIRRGYYSKVLIKTVSLMSLVTNSDTISDSSDSKDTKDIKRDSDISDTKSIEEALIEVDDNYRKFVKKVDKK